MENENKSATADATAQATRDSGLSPEQEVHEKEQPQQTVDETEASEKDVGDEGEFEEEEATPTGTRVRHRRRRPEPEADELRLRGRRALCKGITDIAPDMLKTVKLRVLGRYLESTRGLEDDDLTNIIKKDTGKLADRARILSILNTPDQDFERGQLKLIVLNILLQEETHSLEESRLEEKVLEFEKELVKRSKTLDFFDQKKHDPERWHHYDTYRIVLEAAWTNDGQISPDEARLLGVLRDHLNISMEEHWLISAMLKRFPKEKCGLHTPDEVNEARKEMQRDGVLWGYRDESNRNIDIIPTEIAAVIRKDIAKQELQRTNFRRLLHHDSILVGDLRNILIARNMDRSGTKEELIERIVVSDIKPSEVLNDLDRNKLAEMCSYVGLRTSGNKLELIERLIDFYDDLTFEERVTRDNREVWYANYELLAARSYAELRAKKLIDKDLEIEHMFEEATQFLFEVKLKVAFDRSRKDSRADGRLPLEDEQCILLDCKSDEKEVNLQDYLDGQFDGYMRKERECGKKPLSFLVIGPSFTPQSIKLAHQYKARTNWDMALVTAEGLKHLAERWVAQEPEKPFPIRLLNRTEVIDKERAEFLLSLA
ncbi:MAG: hypothetical protein L0Y58_15770 [Verrucomicrobia subdivision 3 bacterium]|nr:hypothetical protein [Gemmataceae bacterium]MCI0746860.1 hypothetical protein [Limisphaerales bacterium]